MSTISLPPFGAESNAGVSRRTVLFALPLGIWLLAAGKVQAGLQVQGELRALPPPMIEALQRRLHELGYDPGPIDGLWGPRTASAWAAFCRTSDLPLADRLTREHIRTLWDVDFDPETTSGAEMAAFLETIGVRF